MAARRTLGDQAIGGRNGMSIAAATSGVRSIEGDIESTWRWNVAGTDGSAATVMHASAQLMPNDFAGQQGHLGACPPW